MGFDERIELCIDEIVEDIFKSDIKHNAEYQRLRGKEEQVLRVISDNFDKDLLKLFEDYQGIIHAMTEIELHSVYKNGFKHGMKVINCLK